MEKEIQDKLLHKLNTLIYYYMQHGTHKSSFNTACNWISQAQKYCRYRGWESMAWLMAHKWGAACNIMMEAK